MFYDSFARPSALKIHIQSVHLKTEHFPCPYARTQHTSDGDNSGGRNDDDVNNKGSIKGARGKKRKRGRSYNDDGTEVMEAVCRKVESKMLRRRAGRTTRGRIKAATKDTVINLP